MQKISRIIRIIHWAADLFKGPTVWLQTRCVYALWPFGFGFADLVIIKQKMHLPSPGLPPAHVCCIALSQQQEDSMNMFCSAGVLEIYMEAVGTFAPPLSAIASKALLSFRPARAAEKNYVPVRRAAPSS